MTAKIKAKSPRSHWFSRFSFCFHDYMNNFEKCWTIKQASDIKYWAQISSFGSTFSTIRVTKTIFYLANYSVHSLRSPLLDFTLFSELNSRFHDAARIVHQWIQEVSHPLVQHIHSWVPSRDFPPNLKQDLSGLSGFFRQLRSKYCFKMMLQRFQTSENTGASISETWSFNASFNESSEKTILVWSKIAHRVWLWNEAKINVQDIIFRFPVRSADPVCIILEKYIFEINFTSAFCPPPPSICI